jgi:hypothetical protein
VSLAKDAPTPGVRALFMFLWVTLIPSAGLALFFFGPPILNWIELTVGLQSPPPARPPSLPPAAQPMAIYGASSQPIAWKWVVCEEGETLRYACRIWGAQDRLEIVGDYRAQAGTYSAARASRQGRLPQPGETLEYSGFAPERPAIIHLTWPRGARLIARGVLLFPASGTKVTVENEEGTFVTDETPMTADERANVSR